MTPAALQVPPRESGASASSVTGPPPAAIFCSDWPTIWGRRAAALANSTAAVRSAELVMMLTWYSTFHLARTEAAQPLAFAFGGEAAVREVVSGPDAVLEFTVELDGILVNGVDMIRVNEAGRIVDMACVLAGEPKVLLLAPLSGCVDSLGIGGDCSSQMSAVTRTEGRPPDLVQEDDLQGDFSEVWTFWSGSSGRRYSFRWGVSVLSCQVEGPTTVSRVIG